jgi:hypothetical protein
VLVIFNVVPAAAEFVKTGVLRLLHNNILVLHVNMSPRTRMSLEKAGVARGIEDFKMANGLRSWPNCILSGGI